MRIRGGLSAPSRARRSVLSQLEGQIAPTTASDVALIVSELVTNSVLHANVGPGETLTVALTRLDDRVRIASSIQDHDSNLASFRLTPNGWAGWGCSWSTHSPRLGE